MMVFSKTIFFILFISSVYAQSKLEVALDYSIGNLNWKLNQTDVSTGTAKVFRLEIVNELPNKFFFSGSLFYGSYNSALMYNAGTNNSPVDRKLTILNDQLAATIGIGKRISKVEVVQSIGYGYSTKYTCYNQTFIPNSLSLNIEQDVDYTYLGSISPSKFPIARPHPMLLVTDLRYLFKLGNKIDLVCGGKAILGTSILYGNRDFSSLSLTFGIRY